MPDVLWVAIASLFVWQVLVTAILLRLTHRVYSLMVIVDQDHTHNVVLTSAGAHKHPVDGQHTHPVTVSMATAGLHPRPPNGRAGISKHITNEESLS